MKRFRKFFFLILILGVVGMSVILIQERPNPPFSRSLASLFQELGKPVKSLDRTISRILPIDEIDEKLLGEEIKLRFEETYKPKTVEEGLSSLYLNSIITSLSTETNHERFDYRVFLIKGPPNAFALPGGVICITQSLLALLENEAELVSILGHEMGHIERGHLLDAARGEILRRKIYRSSIVSYVSDAIHNIMGVSFSKAQEDEADEYAFRMIIKRGYDPIAMSTALEKLIAGSASKQASTNVFEDFFSTHLYTELRVEKCISRTKHWKQNHPNEKRFLGKKNFQYRMNNKEMLTFE